MERTNDISWEEEFDTQFGCRPHSLEEASKWEAENALLLFQEQGKILKNFIRSQISLAESRARKEVVEEEIERLNLKRDAYMSMIRGVDKAFILIIDEEISHYEEELSTLTEKV